MVPQPEKFFACPLPLLDCKTALMLARRRKHTAKVRTRGLPETQRWLLRQYRQHRLRACSRVDRCRRSRCTYWRLERLARLRRGSSSLTVLTVLTVFSGVL